MKKTLSLIIAILCLLSLLSGCKSKEKDNPLANGPGSSEKAPEEAPVPENDYDIPGVEGLIYDYDLTKYIKLPDYTSPDFKYNRFSTDEAGLEISLLYTKLSSSSAAMIAVDRGAQRGDLVSFDYTLTSDSPGVQAVSAKNISIVLGEEMFAPGFDAYIEGAIKGQGNKFNFTFPSSWTNIADYAGKTASVEVSVLQVSALELPETEEIVTEFGASSVEELYEMLADNIEKTNAANMFEAVVTASEVISYPERELNAHMNMFDKNTEAMAQAQGATVEGIIASEYSGSQSKYDEAKRAYAEQECKRDLVTYLLQDIYGFELSQEEYNLCVEEYFKEYGSSMGLKTVEDAHTFMGQAIADSLFEEMAAQALYQSVNG